MEFCIVHGWSHPAGETDSVDSVGDELYCRTETWPEVVEGTVVSSHCEPSDEPFFTLSGGDLAYLDTVFSGLVPIKMLTIGDTEARAKVTAGRPGFTRGEVLDLRVPNTTLVNRSQVFTRRGQYRIVGPLRLVTDEGDLL